MIAVEIFRWKFGKSDFATTKNEKKMVIAQPLTSGLTMRAVDRWVRAAFFFAFFLALSFFRFDGESQPSHLPLTRAVRQQGAMKRNNQ